MGKLICKQQLLVSKFFRSEIVEVHSSFLEPENLELRLAF